MNSAASNYRFRPLNPFYYLGWQSESESARDADEIIATPEKHLLSADGLYKAEGGGAGLALQAAVVLLGVGSVFATSSRMSAYWRTGSLNRFEWFCLGGTAVSAHYLSHQMGIRLFGDRRAYNNHWVAYGFIKSQNRWQGRQILSKAPMMY